MKKKKSYKKQMNKKSAALKKNTFNREFQKELDRRNQQAFDRAIKRRKQKGQKSVYIQISSIPHQIMEEIQ